MTNGQKAKIVILGSGFGGIYTLKYLHKFLRCSKTAEIHLVGEKNYFLFTPLLHEVATGGLNQSNIVEPIRKLLPCMEHTFHLGKVEVVNTKERTVRVNGTAIPYDISYDYLILATGAETNFYNVPGAAENSFTLKSIEDAMRVKNHIIAQVELATHIADPELKRQMLRFVVVGGGPTGVELVAEIAELVRETFYRYYDCDVLEYVSILLVERGKGLVPQFNEKIQRKSLQVLKKKNIEVFLERSVQALEKDLMVLNDGEKVRTETVIWVGGIRPNLPTFDVEPDKAPDGRLLVDEFLAIPNHENIFAIGDVAAFPSGEKFLPALAQVAQKEARMLARNIARRVEGQPPHKFQYRQSGLMLSLGQWMAAGEVGGFTFSGRLAWWVWRTVYLFKFISWRKKILVAIDWTINLFLPRDISEL